MNASSTHASDERLGRTAAVSLWTVVAAFGAYFCTYGFRKPFTAATFDGQTAFGWDYKSVLVVAQVLGYTLSKFIGIRVIAEFPPARRAAGIIALIAMAGASWLLFPLIPRPFNVLALFLNGLPLGMVFGLVLGFLEGRRTTEALTAGLCASFILADGATKSIGRLLLLHWGVSELWMPLAAAAVFGAPLVVFVAMLARVPAPSERDIELRAPRAPMSRDDRRRFLRTYAAGLAMLTVAYLLVTVLRSLRADFAPELWSGLGEVAAPARYLQTEMFVALGVVAATSLAILIRGNQAAFYFSLATSMAGLALVAVATAARGAGALGPFAYMTTIGLGLYLPYVAVHATIFERLIAMTRERANMGYVMYLVDAFGYLGVVAVVLGKGIWQPTRSFLEFFDACAWVVAGGGFVAFGLAWIAFRAKTRAAVDVPANVAVQGAE